MQGRQLAQNTLLIIVLAALGVSGYLWYRYASIADMQTPAGVSFVDFAKQKPPFKCSASTSNFSGAYGETMYSDGGLLRQDYETSQGSGVVLFHRVVDSSGTAYEWQDGASTGITYAASEEFTPGTAPFSASHCTPWLFPDSSLFAVPESIDFQPGQPAQTTQPS